MEIRLSVEDRFIKTLMNDLKVDKATDVAREALSLLRWAASEVQKDRLILSANRDGTQIHQLVMSILDQVEKVQQRKPSNYIEASDINQMAMEPSSMRETAMGTATAQPQQVGTPR